IIPYIFILSSLAIILSPIIFGANGHWLMFFISIITIAVLSLGTGRNAYNLQSLVLLGICVSTHMFYKKRIDLIKDKILAVEKTIEAVNILKDKRMKTENLNKALSGRLNRYRNLRNIGESFSAKLSLKDIYQLAVDTSFDLIPGSDTSELFIVDESKQQLMLFASKTTTELPRIKSKAGDVYDNWVLKERQPLHINDIKEDFRFDYRPLPDERPFSSLISVPLISQSRLIGVMRLNSKEKNAYTFDDLRLLDFISDLVSSAINNARLYQTTEELSTKDSLTGFYIHRYLKQRLEEEVRRAEKGGLALSIIMLDIDHFKDYNDKYGHSAGDKVLIGISEIISNRVKNGYIIARYGGEEFVMIMPSTEKEKAGEMAEDIRKAVSLYPFTLRRMETRVTVSAGVAGYSESVKNAEELLKRADFCLYKAKKEGRNRICVE
ncbi:MAG: sensor domain-containing diguanylate cyclase, partial [Candidatus Omnitrophota bacterium]